MIAAQLHFTERKDLDPRLDVHTANTTPQVQKQQEQQQEQQHEGYSIKDNNTYSPRTSYNSD